MRMPGPCSPTIFYPPSQKTMDVSPWMNAQGGPSEARRAKEGASADCAEEMKDTTGVSPWRFHVDLNIRHDFIVIPSCVGCERG